MLAGFSESAAAPLFSSAPFCCIDSVTSVVVAVAVSVAIVAVVEVVAVGVELDTAPAGVAAGVVVLFSPTEKSCLDIGTSPGNDDLESSSACFSKVFLEWSSSRSRASMASVTIVCVAPTTACCTSGNPSRSSDSRILSFSVVIDSAMLLRKSAAFCAGSMAADDDDESSLPLMRIFDIDPWLLFAAEVGDSRRLALSELALRSKRRSSSLMDDVLELEPDTGGGSSVGGSEASVVSPMTICPQRFQSPFRKRRCR